MNEKKIIGIVSSFDVLCGNATYSQALADGLSKECNIVRIVVDPVLQKKYNKKLVDELCAAVSQCDAINIQMELGLYGPTPAIASKVLAKIMGSAKHISITIHRIDPPQKNILRTLYNAFKRKSSFFSEIFTTFTLSVIAKAYADVIQKAYQKNAVFICHTSRERKYILKQYPNAQIIVHPIIWPDYQNIAPVDLKNYFKNTYPVIGLFGFITEYKNYSLACESLKEEKYNLFIAGGRHPMSPDYGKVSMEKKPSYIRAISKALSEKSYQGRSFLFNSPDDDELITFIKSVDVVCLPYLETGQSGSGIASLAVQLGKKVIFSDNHSNKLLVEFLNEKPIFFDPDSPLSLKNALFLVLNKDRPIRFKGYDFNTLMKVYLDSFVPNMNKNISS